MRASSGLAASVSVAALCVASSTLSAAALLVSVAGLPPTSPTVVVMFAVGGAAGGGGGGASGRICNCYLSAACRACTVVHQQAQLSHHKSRAQLSNGGKAPCQGAQGKSMERTGNAPRSDSRWMAAALSFTASACSSKSIQLASRK